MCQTCFPPGAAPSQHLLSRRVVLQTLAVAASVVTTGQAAYAKPVKLPAPGPRDTCPVCGMFVAPYPYWVATVLWRDGKAVHFDGAKDFFKYLQDLKKYAPGRSLADLQTMGVTDYYGTGRIDATDAYYVLGSDVLGPMGHELVPHDTEAEAREFMGDHNGRRVLRFREVTQAMLLGLDNGKFA
jgi:nitrous oxide reductase accessory protein NosL